jgi:hypothetical protein
MAPSGFHLTQLEVERADSHIGKDISPRAADVIRARKQSDPYGDQLGSRSFKRSPVHLANIYRKR